MEQVQASPKMYELTQVLPFVAKGQVQLDGQWVKTGRFMVFLKKGTRCVTCGLQATFFKKEKTLETTILNLYGVRNNRMVMFTRDHIIPASRGGTNDLDNMQPMCADCNGRKGDYISLEDRVKETGKAIRRFFYVIHMRFNSMVRILKAIWRR
jgi:hypothetical protein